MNDLTNKQNTFLLIQDFLEKKNIYLRTHIIAELKSMLPEEIELTAHANIKRQIEFSTGRFCAHEALPAKFLKTPIIHDSKKCPIWPPGYCGSITHTDSHACTVIAPTDKWLSIGIDLESIPRVISTNAYRWITNTDERKWVKNCKNRDFQSKLIFSAKESIFKLIYPLTKRFFSFDAISINKPETHNSFTANINIAQDEDYFKEGNTIHGFYFYNNNWLLSITLLKNPLNKK